MQKVVKSQSLRHWSARAGLSRQRWPDLKEGGGKLSITGQDRAKCVAKPHASECNP
jgi:hypothetical protein